MKKTVIFGSGQMGSMLSRLLGSDYMVMCFADNSEKRQGSTVCGFSVVSPQKALAYKPECICIGVLDDERSSQMEDQLRQMGYDGEILKAGELNIFDSRIATMRLLSEEIKEKEVPGAVAELGVFRGDFAKHINVAFANRQLHLFDTFEGFTESDVKTEVINNLSKAKVGDFSDTAEHLVLNKMTYKDNVHIHKGYFPESFNLTDEMFCFVSLDVDLYDPTKKGLEVFWPHISKNGVVMIHDYSSTQFSGVKKAVDEFLATVDDAVSFPVCDMHGSLVVKKI